MYFVGVITGTSVDGLDLAILDLPDDLAPVAFKTVPLPVQLQTDLRALAKSSTDEIFRLGQASVELGKFTAEAILNLLQIEGIQTSQVAAIGSHGQTVRHHPDLKHPFSLQICDASVVAEMTGIDTISDFRSRDIAAGGQGAPLVPIYHQALWGQSAESRVIVNLGGIANITILTNESNDQIVGFDTGPANALLDAWILKCRDVAYDDGGNWAKSGQVNLELLNRLLDDSYYKRVPPKSTGKEHFNLAYLLEYLKDGEYRPEDVQATLVDLTAISVSLAIKDHAQDCKERVICGGGRLNVHLMNRLRHLSEPCRVVTSDSLGIDGDAIEAATFAYLAWLFVERKPANIPSVTGSVGPRILGSLYPA